MLETKRHLEAFEIWFNDGEVIALSAAARKVGCSEISIAKWRDEFCWEERAKSRIDAIKEESDALSVMTVADRLHDMQGILDMAFTDLKDAIDKKTIKWTGSDVKRLVEIQLLMMGQATERVEVYDFGSMSLAQVIAERERVQRELAEITGAGLSALESGSIEE